jgi:hypothetical protein
MRLKEDMVMKVLLGFTPSRQLKSIFILSVISVFLLICASCNFIAPDDEKESDSKNEETRVALSVEETLSASQGNATIEAQQATIQAQAAMATSQAAQSTAQGQQPPVQVTAPVSQETLVPVGVSTPQAPPPQNPPPQGNINELMKSAQILLFEDAVADPSLKRYIKETLDNMGLNYKDEGNAIGWLKNDLLSGSPAGKPWDLVILAIEARGNVSGEYFDYLEDVLNKGTSVIIEAWHLDAISQGKVSPILVQCGVQVYPYFPKNLDLTDVVLYPYTAAESHPIMNDPNRGLTFTKSLNTWLYFGDLGSLMAHTGQGDAIFLLGRDPGNEVKDAALATCMGGKLILQTFSSHSFSYERMGPLWENYITNALRVRFAGG